MARGEEPHICTRTRHLIFLRTWLGVLRKKLASEGFREVAKAVLSLAVEPHGVIMALDSPEDYDDVVGCENVRG